MPPKSRIPEMFESFDVKSTGLREKELLTLPPDAPAGHSAWSKICHVRAHLKCNVRIYLRSEQSFGRLSVAYGKVDNVAYAACRIMRACYVKLVTEGVPQMDVEVFKYTCCRNFCAARHSEGPLASGGSFPLPAQASAETSESAAMSAAVIPDIARETYITPSLLDDAPAKGSGCLAEPSPTPSATSTFSTQAACCAPIRGELKPEHQGIADFRSQIQDREAQLIRKRKLEPESLESIKATEPNGSACDCQPPSDSCACDVGGVDSVLLDEFFCFLQCQLRMEACHSLGIDLDLDDCNAQTLWKRHQGFVAPGINREKWVPVHTVLGPHELFVVQHIHAAQVSCWTAYRRFIAMMVFRAHCKSDIFLKFQLPLLTQSLFWMDPAQHFTDDGPLARDILTYRRQTRSSLQTCAFLSIPARICQDDDENLVRHIMKKTRLLLSISDRIWETIWDGSKHVSERFDVISRDIQKISGFGETWSKMLTMCFDIAYPHLGLLEDQCDVGSGALPALCTLIPKRTDARSALRQLTSVINSCESSSAQHFWQMLQRVEERGGARFCDVPLVCAQLCLFRFGMNLATVQVQLCEWNQFRVMKD